MNYKKENTMRKSKLTFLVLFIFSSQLLAAGLKFQPHFSKSKLSAGQKTVFSIRLNYAQETIPTGASNYRQIINGYLYGFLFAAGGALLTAPIVGKNADNLALPFQVALAGYVVGTTFGVYHSGADSITDASIMATFLGSLVGTALFIIPAPFGALAGFNYTKTDRLSFSKMQLIQKARFIKIAQISFPL